ncbi:hypothetical protein KIF59_12305 [Enterobacter cloacae subsp. cloacae]|nr:hypothetical protein [Enterobacter cloacae subsp. cloacae]
MPTSGPPLKRELTKARRLAGWLSKAVNSAVKHARPPCHCRTSLEKCAQAKRPGQWDVAIHRHWMK